jgi:hypothetical protein
MTTFEMERSDWKKHDSNLKKKKKKKEKKEKEKNRETNREKIHNPIDLKFTINLFIQSFSQ